MSKFTVAIVGCPNVGKSTLYNRLTGTNHAIIDNKPGITRDRRQGKASLGDMKFRIIDTPGLENTNKEDLEARMLEQSEYAICDADICLFLLDARMGVTSVDQFFGNWLRKKNKKIVLVVNKYESDKFYSSYNEALKMGFYIVAISAAHNQGMADLYSSILPHYQEYQKNYADLEVLDQEIDNNHNVIQIAIVGRPNTGKSTLLNCLLKENRALIGPEAGITRDAISIDWQFKNKKIRLIDTAGIRKKSNISDKIEKMSVEDSFRAIRYAHIILLMIDVTEAFEKQDLSIIQMIINEGRAVVLCINKWDLVPVKEQKSTLNEINEKLEKLVPNLKGIKIITISALKNINVEQAINHCFTSYKTWNKRITTAKLNEWLKNTESRHIPPLGTNKKRIKLKYITQGNIRPPTFTLFLNNPKDLPSSYSRYLINSLRESFSLEAVPIRLMLRKSKNPYSKK